jgi:hypothetical protein
MRKSFLQAGSFTCLMLLLPTAGTTGQSIPVKTVPLASGDQFLLIPSRSIGMGGVSIALDHPFSDPFVNPGKGRIIGRGGLFGGSSFYSISGENGSGRTLPLGGTFTIGRWFAGGAAAIQQLTPATPDFQFRGWRSNFGPPLPYRGELPDNQYGTFFLGRRSADGRIGYGIGFSGARLEALEGVEFLYANSQEIRQSGWMGDISVGISGELTGDRAFEVLVSHSRLRMTHEVIYPTWFEADEEIAGPLPATWLQKNLDHTNTTALHLGYVQPMTDPRWRIGGIITGNWKNHPKIPEYVLPDMPPVPRDPGTTWAYNLGLGISKVEGPATFGLDIIYEPIWTETWGEAVEPTLADGDLMIPRGGKTIENDYRFHNYVIRVGVSRELETRGFQLGMHIRSVNYHLNQINNVERTFRSQDEQWIEWIPSWGYALKFPEFELRYFGRLKAGTGRPGEVRGFYRGSFEGGQIGDSPVDYLPTPTGDLSLQVTTVTTHQIALIIPFGR